MILEVGKHYQIDNLTKCFADVLGVERVFEFRVSNQLLLKENNSKPITNFNRVKLITTNYNPRTATWYFYNNDILIEQLNFATLFQRKDNIGFFSFTVEEILSEQDVDIDTAIHEILPSYTRLITKPSHCGIFPLPLGDRVLSSGYYTLFADSGWTLVGVTLHPIGTILASTMPIGWDENLVMNLDDYVISENKLLTPYGFSGDISFTNGAVTNVLFTLSWDTDGTGYEFEGYDIADSLQVLIGNSIEFRIKPIDDANFHFTEESTYFFEQANIDCPFNMNVTVDSYGCLIINIPSVSNHYEFVTPDYDELAVASDPKVLGTVTGGLAITTPVLVDDYIKYNQSITIEFRGDRQHTGGMIVHSFTMGGIDISNLVDLENNTITIEHVTGDINYNVEFTSQIDVNFYNKSGEIEFTYTGERRFKLKIEESLNSIRFLINGVEVHSYTEELEENERLVGFGNQDGELLFPINVEVAVSYYSDKSLYPIIVSDEPETNFTLQLFHMKGEKNLVDKTSVLEPVSTITGTLRESCSVTQPSITCEFSEVPSFNYVYIPSMRRFYFVTEITFISKDIYEVSLHVDVLMTYRYQIKSLKGIVARNEFDFNNLIEDANRQIERTKSIDVVDIRSDEIFTETGNEGVYIVQVVAGEGVL